MSILNNIHSSINLNDFDYEIFHKAAMGEKELVNAVIRNLLPMSVTNNEFTEFSRDVLKYYSSLKNPGQTILEKMDGVVDKSTHTLTFTYSDSIITRTKMIIRYLSLYERTIKYLQTYNVYMENQTAYNANEILRYNDNKIGESLRNLVNHCDKMVFLLTRHRIEEIVKNTDLTAVEINVSDDFLMDLSTSLDKLDSTIDFIITKLDIEYKQTSHKNQPSVNMIISMMKGFFDYYKNSNMKIRELIETRIYASTWKGFIEVKDVMDMLNWHYREPAFMIEKYYCMYLNQNNVKPGSTIPRPDIFSSILGSNINDDCCDIIRLLHEYSIKYPNPKNHPFSDSIYRNFMLDKCMMQQPKKRYTETTPLNIPIIERNSDTDVTTQTSNEQDEQTDNNQKKLLRPYMATSLHNSKISFHDLAVSDCSKQQSEEQFGWWMEYVEKYNADNHLYVLACTCGLQKNKGKLDYMIQYDWDSNLLKPSVVYDILTGVVSYCENIGITRNIIIRDIKVNDDVRIGDIRLMKIINPLTKRKGDYIVIITFVDEEYTMNVLKQLNKEYLHDDDE